MTPPPSNAAAKAFADNVPAGMTPARNDNNVIEIHADEPWRRNGQTVEEMTHAALAKHGHVIDIRSFGQGEDLFAAINRVCKDHADQPCFYTVPGNMTPGFLKELSTRCGKTDNLVIVANEKSVPSDTVGSKICPEVRLHNIFGSRVHMAYEHARVNTDVADAAQDKGLRLLKTRVTRYDEKGQLRYVR